jgi:mRNA interferase MazF
MSEEFVPHAGDVLAIRSNGPGDTHRAVVLSGDDYNKRTGLVICCGITSRQAGNPFEVTIAALPDAIALADQVRTLNWRNRAIVRLAGTKPGELAEIRKKLRLLTS